MIVNFISQRKYKLISHIKIIDSEKLMREREKKAKRGRNNTEFPLSLEKIQLKQMSANCKLSALI